MSTKPVIRKSFSTLAVLALSGAGLLALSPMAYSNTAESDGCVVAVHNDSSDFYSDKGACDPVFVEETRASTAAANGNTYTGTPSPTYTGTPTPGANAELVHEIYMIDLEVMAPGSMEPIHVMLYDNVTNELVAEVTGDTSLARLIFTTDAYSYDKATGPTVTERFRVEVAGRPGYVLNNGTDFQGQPTMDENGNESYRWTLNAGARVDEFGNWTFGPSRY